ncbi:MAG: hypothetical protein HYS89_00875 [Candidatus Colwellbacteria bacterium]|nr:hypothetical protein [Candidatus Colwellbacteria bacterium]
MKSPKNQSIFAVFLATVVVLSLSTNFSLLQVGYADDETASVASETASSETSSDVTTDTEVPTDSESSPAATEETTSKTETISETESIPEPEAENGSETTPISETESTAVEETEFQPEVTETESSSTETETSAPEESSSLTELETQSEPTLTTDETDYHPGGVVTILGRFFQSFQNILLKISGEGTEEIAPSEESAAVTANAEGSFTHEYTLEDVYRPLYTVVASTLSGERLAETSFTDSAPDLTATKSNNVNGTAGLNGTFTWKVRVENVGTAEAVFNKNEKILQDEMPSTGVDDYDPAVITTSGTGGTGSIICDQTGAQNRDLNCKVSNNTGDTITIPVGAYIDFSVGVHPTAIGTITNPRTNQTCKADPGNKVAELADNNNSCNTNSVTVVDTGTLTVKKVVINDNGGTLEPGDFSFQVNGGEPIDFEQIDEETGENELSVDPDTYTITEPMVPGYTTSYDNCDDLDIPAGGSATCTITNDDESVTLIIQKLVINDNGGTFEAQDFSFQVNGGEPIDFEEADSPEEGENELTLDAGNYTVTEPEVGGYSTTYDNCSEVFLSVGETATCVITNDDQPGTLIVEKVVINDDDGDLTADDFSLFIDDAEVINGEENTVDAGDYIVSEDGDPGYTASFSGDCDENGNVTVGLGETKTCTITNDDNPVIIPPVEPELGSIFGTKFNDLNGDGIWDDDEPGLEDWTIQLWVGDDQLDETLTDVDGLYSFEDLEDDNYFVCELLQNDWVQTFPDTEDGCWEVSIVDGSDETNVNFGNQVIPAPPISTIVGYKWNDLDVDGIWDEGELGLGGWLINLLNSDDETLATTETDDDGRFTFPIDEPGTYHLNETAQENWQRTNPADSFFDIFVDLIDGNEINQDVDGNFLDFGNTHFVELLGGHFAATSGNSGSTPSVITLGETEINVPTGDGMSTITLPNGVVITRSDGENIDIGELVSEAVTADSLSGLAGGVVVDGALKWGLPDTELAFDPAITLNIFVGVDLNGRILDILRSTSGVEDWTNDGIGPPTTCVVTDGLCTFTATKASVYAATHSSGGSFLGTSVTYTTYAEPEEEEEEPAPQEETEIPAETPTPPETPGITIEQPAAPAEEGSAGSETPGAPSEEPAPPALAEEEPAPAPETTSDLPKPLPPLLATMLSALMLGTENTYVGMLVGAALGALATYLIYLLSRKLRG